jgi:hypothetical protein
MNQAVSQLRLNVYMLAGTLFLHGGMMVANELFFRRTEFLQGIGWIYIPAGTRLLCTLLFGPAGTLGLLISGWLATYLYYFPGDAVRATVGTIASSLGPFIVYLFAVRSFGLKSSLANLTPGRLLVCAAASSIASPLLHHLWFALRGESGLLPGFLVMCIGDFAGTLVVLYTFKALLALGARMDRARED